MKLLFTKHALERMDERGIAHSEVRDALHFPLKVNRQNDLYVAKRIRANGHLLIVVHLVQEGFVRVITVIDTSKVSKYL